MAWFAASRTLTEQQVQLAQVRGNTPTAPKPTAVTANRSAPDLPWFESAQLVGQFSQVAEDSKLPLDEVGYLLEEGTQQPYLRYRITLSVSASYPAVRQFADNISATMRHVDLDSISCTRSDIAVAPLTCELAFSAFFRKDADGR